MPNLLTTIEAAAILADRGVRIHGKPPTSKTVAFWCRLGAITATHFAGRWAIDTADLDGFNLPPFGPPKQPPLELDATPQAGICRVVGCGDKARTLGLCHRHYRAMYRAGRIEEAKQGYITQKKPRRSRNRSIRLDD